MDKQIIGIATGHDNYGVDIARGIARYMQGKPNWEVWSELNKSMPILRDPEIPQFNGRAIIGRFMDPKQIAVLRRRRMIVINVSHREEYLDVPTVGPDDVTIGRMAAEYYLQRGFTHFAYVGIDAHWYSRQRYVGFAQRLYEAGRDCLRIGVDTSPPDLNVAQPERSQLEQFLHTLPRPTAIMTCNDIRGRHVIEACAKLGINVPNEIAVLGVDNDEWQSLLTRSPLSSIDPDPQGIGYAAAKLLDGILQKRPNQPQRILIPPKGVLSRHSTDVVAVTDPVVAKAVEYVRARLAQPLHVDNLVTVAGVSRRNLEMRFKQYLGQGPQQFIWQMRVDRAKTLILQSDLTMKEIATRCGFTDSVQFSVVFRRIMKVAPGQYREKFRT
ncbi:MAG: substrate-binding domain-containing protein [Phycisphaerae bacterium]